MNLKLDQHEVSAILDEIAVLLELKGENPFKVRAYQNAERTIGSLGDRFSEVIEQGKLEECKGIGKVLAEKITTLAQTGKLDYYEELRKDFPSTLFELLKVPGLGPKKVKILYEKLDVKSLGELEYACKENRLIKLDGFGEKTQEKILAGIEYLKKNLGRFLFADAIDLAESVVKTVSTWKGIDRVSLAGSLRRRKEIVKDVDIVCSSKTPKAVMKKFVELEGVGTVIAHGETKSSVLWKNGIQIDLRVVKDLEFPYALHHFTGSKEHNTALRTLAKEKGLKMNEYGLFKEEKLLLCKNEEEIFKALGLYFIPPEMREDRGEIESAKKGKIPSLIELDDLTGFFHVHSTYSDGKNSLEEMVHAASKMGIQYLGISDHSQSAFYANGLKEADIDRQHQEIDQLQKKYPKVKLFKGIESDILPDGSLDYPDRILKKFEFVIGSVHSKFNLSEEEMTQRCLKALENPYCTILGHPTGRLLLAREEFKIRLHALIDRAAELGKVVELNANPHRLDLDWRILSYAKEKGLQVAINPDAHSIEGLSDIRFGVYMARKGGLTKKDVFNTLPLPAMGKALEKARS